MIIPALSAKPAVLFGSNNNKDKKATPQIPSENKSFDVASNLETPNSHYNRSNLSFKGPSTGEVLGSLTKYRFVPHSQQQNVTTSGSLLEGFNTINNPGTFGVLKLKGSVVGATQKEPPKTFELFGPEVGARTNLSFNQGSNLLYSPEASSGAPHSQQQNVATYGSFNNNPEIFGTFNPESQVSPAIAGNETFAFYSPEVPARTNLSFKQGVELTAKHMTKVNSSAPSLQQEGISALGNLSRAFNTYDNPGTLAIFNLTKHQNPAIAEAAQKELKGTVELYGSEVRARTNLSFKQGVELAAKHMTKVNSSAPSLQQEGIAALGNLSRDFNTYDNPVALEVFNLTKHQNPSIAEAAQKELKETAEFYGIKKQ